MAGFYNDNHRAAIMSMALPNWGALNVKVRTAILKMITYGSNSQPDRQAAREQILDMGFSDPDPLVLSEAIKVSDLGHQREKLLALVLKKIWLLPSARF